ncbi:MAG TPA: alpha-amylase family protein [Gemmatimonadaceae bacterium]|jgi:alpha-amylase
MRVALSCAALCVALVAACGGGSDTPSGPAAPGGSTGPVGRPVLAPAYRPTGHAEAGDTFVQLFSWYWTDVGAECGRSLGPAGYRAALVSPPQEHNIADGRPWFEVYGPVSYSIDRGKFGTRAEFVDMVAKCRAANVDIYVDAVINHMAPGSGVGSAGTPFTRYNYQPLYGPADFHPACALNNYQSAANVQDCELLGLPDLNTGSASVRQKIADYLIGLTRLGVAGFRIDAAKHIQPVELDSIVRLVNLAAVAEGRAPPYFFLEVIDPGTEAVKATDYFGLGYASGGAADVTEFNFRAVGERFRAGSGKRASELSSFTQRTWGLMASNKAVVFLQNHDTQRYDGVDYRDGVAYRLANVWMLGQGYGYPVVMSGYAFDRSTQAGRDAGPPAPAATLNCAASFQTAVVGQWTCDHRDPWIVTMVAFRRATAGLDVTHTWDNGADAVAFTRGDKGWVMINAGATSVTATINAGLPAGMYCDLLAGGRVGDGCAGLRVTVAADGTATVTLPATSAVAIRVGVAQPLR